MVFPIVMSAKKMRLKLTNYVLKEGSSNEPASRPPSCHASKGKHKVREFSKVPEEPPKKGRRAKFPLINNP